MERQNFCQKLYGIKQKAFRVTLVVVNILHILLGKNLEWCLLLLLLPLCVEGRTQPKSSFTHAGYFLAANCEKFSLMHFHRNMSYLCQPKMH